MTKMKKATLKETTLSNPLAKGKKVPSIDEVYRFLNENKEAERIIARGEVGKFMDMLKQSGDLRLIIAVADSLTDETKSRRKNAARLMKRIVAQGIDITPTIPKIIEAVENREEGGIREISDDALDLIWSLMIEKRTREHCLPQLLGGLSQNNSIFTNELFNFLYDILLNGDDVDRKFITEKILDFMHHSEWFKREMERNSTAYEMIADNFSAIFGQIREKEVGKQ